LPWAGPGAEFHAATDLPERMTLLTLCYKRSVDLISDVLPFDQVWYGGVNAISNAIYARIDSRSSGQQLHQ
jgi:hypothetical protein